MSAESALIARILKRHGARSDVRLFRNATAKAWVGKVVGRTANGDLILRGARQIHAGLAIGSADLIGVRRAPHRFISLEVKTDGVAVEPHQKSWGNMVEGFEGLHAVVRSVEDVDAVLGEP